MALVAMPDEIPTKQGNLIMKNVTRHTGILEMVKRLPNSKNGNPRFKLRCDGWSFFTQPDSMVGYMVENYIGKPVTVTIGTHYGKCQLNTIEGNA